MIMHDQEDNPLAGGCLLNSPYTRATGLEITMFRLCCCLVDLVDITYTTDTTNEY